MNIYTNNAILSYGSLVNQPSVEGRERLKCSNFAKAENLSLPIRLGRISEKKQIVKVIDPKASDENVYYALSELPSFQEAVNNLKERQGASNTNHIFYLRKISSSSEIKRNEIGLDLEGSLFAGKIGLLRARMDKVREIGRFILNQGLNSAIWSSYKPNISLDEAAPGREIINLLKSDSTLLANTKEYIQNLPGLDPLQKAILKNEAENLTLPGSSSFDYQNSLTGDFEERDRMPESPVPRSRWPEPESSLWGPIAAIFPPVEIPAECDPIQWQRDRVIEVAKHYTGVPYRHHHIPSLGIDCSNFTSWVYNYGLGNKFNSHVVKQSEQVGRKLGPQESLKKGDLLYFWGPRKDGRPGKEIRHVGLYIDENTLIDSTTTSQGFSGVKVRPFAGWYKSQFAFVRRVIE